MKLFLPKSILAFAIIVALGFATTVSICAADKTTELDAYLTAANEVLQFHGAALVAQNGEIIFDKGYGMADVELGVANTPDMKFLIGSITKQFTAAGILQLQEQGRLSVKDPLTKYLPEFPSDPGDEITLDHLLTHTSGVHSYTDDGTIMVRRTVELSSDSLLALIANYPLDFEPGEKYYYSNSGYYLLGIIIERVSGMPYERYLRTQILQPAGMETAGLAKLAEIIPNRAEGYYLDDDGNLRNATRVHMSLPFSAGAMYATVKDLFKWHRALYSDAVLSDESKQAMFTPGKNDYAYGVVIEEKFGRTRISHGGGIDGFNSQFAHWPDDSLCFVVFSNNVSISAGNLLGDLEAIMFEKPYDMPVKRKPIAWKSTDLRDYVGPYKINESEYRKIISINDTLHSQRSGGPSVILPYEKDKFYFDYDNTITLKFVRDDDGKVIAHVIHQGGIDERAERVTGPLADSIMAGPKQAEVDPAIYDDYVGEYELGPGFILTVRTRDQRIFTEATGQSESEIFPTSETEFFLKVVDAQLTFQRDDSGTVTGVILHQGGRDLPAKKIK